MSNIKNSSMHPDEQALYDLITKFISIDTYNSVPNDKKNPLRLIFESLYDALVLLSEGEADEISVNSDNTLWIYGNKNICYGVIRPALAPKFHDDDLEVEKRYVIRTNRATGFKEKIEIDDSYVVDTNMEELIKEKQLIKRPITHSPEGLLYLDRLDPKKAIKALASFHKIEVHEQNPVLEVEIPFLNHRFSGSLPPITANTSFNIRSRPRQIYTLDDYIKQGALTESDKKSLVNAIKEKQNILVIGGTKSGKTTFCNALLAEMSKFEDSRLRVLIIEDLRELVCDVPNHEFLTVPPFSVDNIKINNVIDVAFLLKHAMRRSPTRMCVGEIRDGKVADALIKAWNSGHPGGVSTIHANSAEEGIHKLEDYLSEVVNVNPLKLASVVNVLVSIQIQDSVFIDGKWIERRSVNELKRIDGYNKDAGKYRLSDM